MDWLEPVLTALVIVTVALSLVAVRRLERRNRRWRDVLRARFLYGVPWGTLIIIAFVLAFYLFVQDGISDFDSPVVKPFRAWSFFYPLGILSSSFSHAHAGHITGNLIGTVVAAPIAEYAWGHYPRERDGSDGWGPAWLHNPWVRACAIFPGVVVLVGLFTGLFALGPVIGFSGVVYAFAGFAIVRYPIVTLIATVGLQSVVSRTFDALQTPIGYYVAQPQGPSPPSWATIAIQGHALGFFIGLFLALALFRYRGHRPNVLSLWIAVLVYGFSKSLWAIYWFGGADVYILLQGPGVIVVIALAAVVVVAVAGSDRGLAPRWLERRFSRPTADEVRSNGLLARVLERGTPQSASSEGSNPKGGARLERIRELVARPRSSLPAPLTDYSRQSVAIVVLLVVLAAITGPAIPVNLFVYDGDGEGYGETTITIEDYSVTYAEDVDNPIASVVGVEEFDPGSLDASGVIVSSPERQIWTEAVSANQLAFSGEATVTVGGPAWRDSVTAEREGWSPVGNDTVYQVWLEDDDDRILAHTSNESRVGAQIDGQNITVGAEDGEFYLEVSDRAESLLSADNGEAADQDGTVTAERVELPAENETASVGTLEFVRVDDDLYVTTGETIVQIASKESYN